jgi:hypothetical protein
MSFGVKIIDAVNKAGSHGVMRVQAAATKKGPSLTAVSAKDGGVNTCTKAI